MCCIKENITVGDTIHQTRDVVTPLHMDILESTLSVSELENRRSGDCDRDYNGHEDTQLHFQMKPANI